MTEGEVYDADYFLRGKKTGKSLYEDYRWMPDLTIPMVCSMVEYCGIEMTDKVLDFGCARGYVVRALRELGYMAFGVDASEWAIQNADDNVKRYVWHCRVGLPILFYQEFDWIIAKDVLEHVRDAEGTIRHLMKSTVKGIFAVVPLAPCDGAPYVVEEYEKDVTHIHRLSLSSWAAMFMKSGWRVHTCCRVPGIKDNYAQYEGGNGFITARRV